MVSTRQIVMPARSALRRARAYGPSVLRGRANLGWCPICGGRTLFVNTGGHPRNHLRCVRCGSIPRWRALIHVLGSLHPNWRDLEIHESSPGGAAAHKLRAEAHRYSSSNWLPAVERGTLRDERRSEDLERLTFPDSSFDLFITQDVLEHIFDAPAAFREVARVLRPGGAHIFTVPYWPGRPTRVRAVRSATGTEHLREPVYHNDPIDPAGALVVRDWGNDTAEIITEACGLETEVFEPQDRRLGLLGDFLQVLVTKKPPP